MRTRRRQKGDTAKKFLQQLALDKGTVLAEDGYQSVRSWRIQTLAKPRRIEWEVAAPGLVSTLVGVGLLITAFVRWVRGPEPATI